MGENMIEIKESEYDGLHKDRLKLTALENHGVDNWPGYDDAMEEFEGWLEDEEDE